MTQGAQSVGIPAGVKLAHEGRRGGTEHLEQRLDGCENAGHASERQARRAEGGDFTVGGIAVAANEVDGVGGRFRMVELAIQPLEGRLCRPQ